jgi:hypothetical protein
MSREPDEHNLINFIAATVETMREQMAKKSDIARVESKLETITAVIRGDIEQVSFRLDSIDRALSPNGPDRKRSQPSA